MCDNQMTLPDGRTVDGQEFASTLVECEIPTLFGELSAFIGSTSLEAHGLAYEFERIEFIRDNELAARKPGPLAENLYLDLFEMGVIKFCPRQRIVILEDGSLVAPSNVIYPDWLCFGKLISVSASGDGK